MNGPKKKRDVKQILAVILFSSLVLSAVLTLIRLIWAPAASPAGEYDMRRGDHTLMLVQCVMGIVVMMLPSAIERKWSIPIPDVLYVLYYIFLYCAVFLGEVLSFYYLVPHWDTILHGFSGAALASLGFILVNLLNENRRVRVELSPFFAALFAFSFALAVGAVWEIYEYANDSLMALNMQKYMTAEGVEKIGRAALVDTMKDLIIDAATALAVSSFGYISLKRRRNEMKMQEDEPDIR